MKCTFPCSTAITADIENGNYRCSSASDDIGQYPPDIAVLPGLMYTSPQCMSDISYQQVTILVA